MPKYADDLEMKHHLNPAWAACWSLMCRRAPFHQAQQSISGLFPFGKGTGQWKASKTVKEKCSNLNAAVKVLIREKQLPLPAQLWDRGFASPSAFNFLAAVWTE